MLSTTMGLADREYMRRHDGGSWWRDRSPQELLVIGILAVSLLSSLIWLGRDIGRSATPELTKGSLRVNINTASEHELQTLPGIGDSRARLIIAHRPYKSVDELAKLRGIGRSLTEDLRPLIKTEGRNERVATSR